jgi:hypothetical protein
MAYPVNNNLVLGRFVENEIGIEDSSCGIGYILTMRNCSH